MVSVLVRRLGLIVTCIILSVAAISQSPFGKISFEAGIGLSIPTGSFSNKGYNQVGAGQEVNGRAKTGILIGGAIQYAFSNNIDVSLLVSGSINGQDADAVKSQVEKQYGITTTSVNAEKWKQFQILPGLRYKWRLGRGSKSGLSFGAHLGLLYANIPQYSFTTNSSQATIYKVKLKAALAWSLASSYHYSFGNSMNIFARVSYTHGMLVNEYRYYPNPLSDPNVYSNVKDKYPLSLFGMVLGISLRIK